MSGECAFIGKGSGRILAPGLEIVPWKGAAVPLLKSTGTTFAKNSVEPYKEPGFFSFSSDEKKRDYLKGNLRKGFHRP